MPTVRLIPSTYYLSNSTYLSVSNASNMYNNTDNTTYATVYNSRTSTTSYYIYLRGFNFSSVPSDAIVSSFTIKLKAYESGVSTSYVPTLANGTTTIDGSTTAITTTTSVHTFTGVTADWDTIKGYGSNFGIKINCRRYTKNTAGYVYIYGAEIEVTYTIPVYHSITASASAGSISPSGTTSVLEGDDYELVISGVTPSVTDNGVDVTSQLVQSSRVDADFCPSGYTGNSNFTLSNIDNAYDTEDSTGYAQLQLAAGGTTGSVYFTFGGISLPSGATVISVSCKAGLQYNRNGSSSGFTASCQMYSGTTAKGSSTSIVTAGGTDVAKTTFTLTPGSWTASELANARFYITATNNASGTTRYLYVYGATLTVTYESDGVVYIYTLTNVTADHVIVVSQAAAGAKIFIKTNGSWTELSYSKVYKKVSGSWVEQSDPTDAFDSNVNYVQG